MTSKDLISKGEIEKPLKALIEQCRAHCLWNMPLEYFPETLEEIHQVLKRIEAHGTGEEYIKSRELQEWLSLPSKKKSATSYPKTE